MGSLGVAIVGAGPWGTNHAQSYRELDEVDLLAVCDIDSARANEVARRFGAAYYTNAHDMLKREDIDAVSVCTWSINLGNVALQALEAGKHVLVEKPMAMNSQEASRLVETAKKAGLKLAVGYLTRFTRGLQCVKRLVESGEVGSLVCATAIRVSQWPERIGDVGVVKDLAVHDIDLMRYIFNGDPIAIYARTGRVHHKEFEDYSQIMLVFENGKSAFIESNWLTPYKTRALTITGSKAIVKLDFVTQQLAVSDIRGEKKLDCFTQNPLKLELEHFVSCVRENKELSVDGSGGLRVLQIAEAALKSSEQGLPVIL